MFYGLSDQEFGLHLLTYRKSGEPGYFMMMLAPKQEWAQPENTDSQKTFVSQRRNANNEFAVHGCGAVFRLRRS